MPKKIDNRGVMFLELRLNLWMLVNFVPKGIQFGCNLDYEDRCRAFNEILAALPMIDDWRPECSFPDLNDLAQARLDAEDIGEVSLCAHRDIQDLGSTRGGLGLRPQRPSGIAALQDHLMKMMAELANPGVPRPLMQRYT